MIKEARQAKFPPDAPWKNNDLESVPKDDEDQGEAAEDRENMHLFMVQLYSTPREERGFARQMGTGTRKAQNCAFCGWSPLRFVFMT